MQLNLFKKKSFKKFAITTLQGEVQQIDQGAHKGKCG